MLLVLVEVEEVGAPLLPPISQPGRAAADDPPGLQRVELFQARVIVEVMLIILALEQRIIVEVELLVELDVVEGVAGVVFKGLEICPVYIKLVLPEECRRFSVGKENLEPIKFWLQTEEYLYHDPVDCMSISQCRPGYLQLKIIEL